MLSISLALFYVGPDQIMPVTSALAAIGGVLVIFWRQVTGAARRFLSLFSRR